MTFGLIRECKNPPDHRAVLSPAACQIVKKRFPKAHFLVESSSVRDFSDQEYREAGISVVEDMSGCDVLLGVKEVPIESLIPNKKYFFFSHTIKKQPYNRDLLRAILNKNIEFYDHEVITNPSGNRLVAFGRYAGIVGAYNGLRAFGLKTSSYDLPKAGTLSDQEALIDELRKLELPPIKVLLTGRGRVGSGAQEILDGMGMQKATVQDYLSKQFPHPVYCQIDASFYNKRKDGTRGSKEDFIAHPERYESNFFRFAKVTDLYLAGHFYGDGAPYLITRDDARHPDFKIRVIADISCDIDGPVAPTIRASTIADPIYGYNPHTERETHFLESEAIAVMAVDNLPAELPRDASEGFGAAFVKSVIPAFFNGDKDGILERARMTRQGKLTPRYAYLQDYVDGK
ncbi:MAG: NAD(P)-dependent oxidoreductase [Robiginitalea sp.]|uniref:NAD(P)-dependent oxidoreductase n=1 Tax=Robiginitalea sp. TaxID=1902411 RepID=UPI003C7153E3